MSESIVEYLNIKDLCLLKSVSKEYAKTQLVFKNEEARNKEWFKIVNNGNSNEILLFLNNQNDEYSSLNLNIIQEKTERNLLQIALQQNNYKLFQMVLCSPDYNLYIPSFEEILTSFVTVRSCKNIKAKIDIFQLLKDRDITRFRIFKDNCFKSGIYSCCVASGTVLFINFLEKIGFEIPEKCLTTSLFVELFIYVKLLKRLNYYREEAAFIENQPILVAAY